MSPVDRILYAYDNATPAEHDRGRAWYADYRARVRAAAAETDTPEHRAYGVVAVSSINTAPEQGLAWARRFMAGAPGGHLGNVCDKAARILATAETFEDARDIATPYTPAGARKVRAFGCNVRTGGEMCEHAKPCVTVDRHAHRIATGIPTVGVPKGRAYDAIADAYRTAAAMRGVSPAVMQAVVWVTVAE